MSGTPASSLRAPRWSGTTPVRRALSALLWEAGPTLAVPSAALLVLALGGLVLASLGGAPPVDSSGAAALAATAGVFVPLAWVRAGSTQVPVLVAHGVTRRAVTRALLIGAPASAVVLTVVMLVAAVLEVAVQGPASTPLGHAGVWAGQLLAAYTGLALLGGLAGVLAHRWSGARSTLVTVAAGVVAVVLFILGTPLVILTLADALTPTGAWALLALLAAAGVPLAVGGLALRRPPG